MSRRRRAKKRIVSADPVYQSILVHMVVNRIMKNGKKTLAYKIVYKALDQIKQKTNTNPLKTLEAAIKNVTPEVEVKARRVGGSALQIPLEVKSERGTVLAIQWILSAARKRPGRGVVLKLTQELLDASKNNGGAMKRRGEVQRMAEANKAFARFRF